MLAPPTVFRAEFTVTWKLTGGEQVRELFLLDVHPGGVRPSLTMSATVLLPRRDAALRLRRVGLQLPFFVFNGWHNVSCVLDAAVGTATLLGRPSWGHARYTVRSTAGDVSLEIDPAQHHTRNGLMQTIWAESAPFDAKGDPATITAHIAAWGRFERTPPLPTGARETR